jgi:cytoskeletal protein RodZ
LNFPSPFPLHSGELILVAAALGAIAGLSFFFHGFSLLQQRWPSPLHRPMKASASNTGSTEAAKSSEAEISDSAQTETRSARPEVIKLTPQEPVEVSSASMTQQGRIAAALLKAGIPSPATWTNESMQVTVRVEEQSARPAHTSEADVSRVLQQGANASEFRIPALNQDAARTSSWRATAMIWGGPALTLTCIYILASRLGWL